MRRIVGGTDGRWCYQNHRRQRGAHDGPCHCALAPDFFTMSDHLVSSLSMSAAYSSGVEASGSVPSAASFCLNSSVMTALRKAALSLSMIGFGVPAGATMP